MSPDTAPGTDERVLILAPTARDADVTTRVLAASELACHLCANVQQLVADIEQGVGAVVLTDYALGDPAFGQVIEALTRQPEWSKVPFVMLSRDREPTPRALRLMDELQNVVVIDRPSSVRTLISSVQGALRGRRWQYRIRDQLIEQRESQAALQLADRRKDEFLATLSHELRNPLAPLRNGLQLMQRLAPEGGKLEPVRQMMERQMRQLLKLVDELLDISRIASGKVVLHRERMDLCSAIEVAVEGSQALVDGGHHTLDVALPACPVMVLGDASRLAQAVGNLVNNAAKYTPSGGRIQVSLTAEGGQAVLRVADNGLGIPADMLDRVFDMFAQVNQSLDRAQGGLGIGLSLVRSILALHGGTAQARSGGLGHGSTFELRLPLLAPADGDADARHPDSSAMPAATRPLRVLVIDDNVDAATSLGLLVESMGHTVQVEYSAPAALQSADAFGPEVVFCDVGMPDMTGLEFSRRLRARPGSGTILMVAVTGWGSQDDQRRTVDAGFDVHLTKPAGLDHLHAVLARR